MARWTANSASSGPALEETGMVRTHVAVQEQQAAAPRGGGEAVAADGAAFIRGQGDQATGQGHRSHLFGESRRQRGVASAVVQEHDLDRAVQRPGLSVQPGQQVGWIVAQERDQDRQGGGRDHPAGVVEDVRAHAAALRDRRFATSRMATSRTPAALIVRAAAA
jgi:hypothetical protein